MSESPATGGHHVPAASVAAGATRPFFDEVRDLPAALRTRCDTIVVRGARWQLLLVAGLFVAAGALVPVVGPIAIAFGMACCVPVSIFGERRVVVELSRLGLSPRLARFVARGGRLSPPRTTAA